MRKLLFLTLVLVVVLAGCGNKELNLTKQTLTKAQEYIEKLEEQAMIQDELISLLEERDQLYKDVLEYVDNMLDMSLTLPYNDMQDVIVKTLNGIREIREAYQP